MTLTLSDSSDFERVDAVIRDGGRDGFDRIDISIYKDPGMPPTHQWTSTVLVDGERTGRRMGSHSPQGAYDHALVEVYLSTGLEMSDD